MLTVWSVVFLPVIIITVLTTFLAMRVEHKPSYVTIGQCTLINVLFVGTFIAVVSVDGFDTGIGIHLGDNVFQENDGYVTLRHQIYAVESGSRHNREFKVYPAFQYYRDKGILQEKNILRSFNSNNEAVYHYTKDGVSRHEPSLLFTMRKNSIHSWRRFFPSHPYFLANLGYISALLSFLLAPMGILAFVFGNWHEELFHDIADKFRGEKKKPFDYSKATYADFKRDEDSVPRDICK
ncbi:MAG: hypothetical protein LAT83_01800 [Kiritimatiellae bacterium]|nr:hypothetical protein [Kiritimatiellia bacterium]